MTALGRPFTAEKSALLLQEAQRLIHRVEAELCRLMPGITPAGSTPQTPAPEESEPGGGGSFDTTPPPKPSFFLPPTWVAHTFKEPVVKYKVVAAVGGKLVSIFNEAVEYHLGRTLFAHRGDAGWAPLDCCYFVYDTAEQAKHAVLPQSSKHLGAPRVLISLRVVGRAYVLERLPYKMAFQQATPVKILGYRLQGIWHVH